MQIELSPIGVVRTGVKTVPRHWSESELEGRLVIDESYRDGLKGILPGDRIIVIFHFHESRGYTPQDLTQHPRGDTTREKRGVFDLCSPVRPNPIGMSVVEVTDLHDNIVSVKGLDMVDGTPVLDIKPHRHFDRERS